MTWTRLLAHVQAAEGCDEPEARRQISDAIGDRVMPVRWGDEHKEVFTPGPIQLPADEPPRDLTYWLECKVDDNDPDKFLEPPPYDSGCVNRRTARRLDKTRRFRRPIFKRDHVLQL